MHVTSTPAPGDEIAAEIRRRGLTIYDHDEAVRYDLKVLAARMRAKLLGLVWDVPIKTRSKLAKIAVCEALGYEAPPRFRRVHPRLPAQDLEVAVYRADNFQPWNQQLDPIRRYCFLRVDANGQVTAVRCVSGEELALFDRTGTLTSKYQAARKPGRHGSTLVSATDTTRFGTILSPTIPSVDELVATSATDRPVRGLVLPIQEVFDRLLRLVGTEIVDPGLDQERLRGVALQQLVVPALGLGSYADTGQVPDILSQALEVKLQLARTIDLGLLAPDSELEAPELGRGLQHRDVRYAVFYGTRVDKGRIRIAEVVVSTGASFFEEFNRFEGKVQNSKLQMRLPKDFFNVP